MDQRRNGRFYTKRSAHYNNLQKQEEEEKLKSSSANNNNNNNNNSNSSNNNNSNSVPLKDNSNIKPRKSAEVVSQLAAANSSATNSTVKLNSGDRSKGPGAVQIRIPIPPASTSSSTKSVNRKIVPSLNNQNLVPKVVAGSNSNERPLKCLESLAQQAGVTQIDQLNQTKMEKTQNQQQQVPLQLSAEQLQQLQQQFHLQQAFAAGGTAIQVKQEFPQSQANTIEQLNKQIQEQNQAAQVQQMQLIDASTSQHQSQNNAMGIKYVNGEQQQQHQQTTTTMTTMPPLQLQNGQLPADWNQRVQVVQQPIQNQPYLQTIYGQQVLMPGNIIQPNFNQQPQIQVIAAGKPLQAGQITQQMLANAQGKPVQLTGNSTTGFSGTYTLPTNSQSQTLLFSPVNVFSSQPQQQQQQQNILPMTTTTTQNNSQIASKNQQQELKTFPQQQKVVQKTNTVNAAGQTIAAQANAQQNQQCVQVSQSAIPAAQIINQIQQPGGQQMQFTAPWLQSPSFPQLWTTNGLPPQFQNSIFIRPDGTQGMFIPQPQTIQTQAQAQPTQQNQQQTAQSQAQQQQQIQQATAQQPTQTQQQQQQVQQAQANTVQQTIIQQNSIQSTPNKQRLVAESLASKQQTPTRTPTLLPQNTNQTIRPNQASSVSTQTSVNQSQVLIGQKNAKIRKQPPTVRPAVPNLKTDAGNQTKLLTGAQTLQQIPTSAGTKMVVTMNNNGTQMIQQMIPKQQQTFLQQQPNQQIQMIPQQMQLQQIQIQPSNLAQNQTQAQAQAQFVNQQEQHQQIQNQIMQSQQIALQQQQQQHQQQQQQQQQAQSGLNVSQSNGIQQITIQQPKQQILIGQQSMAQNQGTMENRPIMTMVSIGGGTNTGSPLNAIQNLSSPISSSQHITIQPPPNPLAAMTSLSYSAAPSAILTNSTANITKDDKNAMKTDDAQKSTHQNGPESSIHMSTANSTSTTVTTVANASITISSATSTPTISTNASKDKQTDSVKSTIAITTSKSSPRRAAENAKLMEKANNLTVDSTKANSTTTTVATSKSSPKKVDSPKPAPSPKSSTDKPTPTSSAPNSNHNSSTNDDKATSLNGTSAASARSTPTPIPAALNVIKGDKGIVPIPKAMVKPNVLTHVIGGHVIQEGTEPFPVTRQRYAENDSDGPPSKRRNTAASSPEKPAINAVATPDKLSCIQCGKKDSKGKLKHKPYCSKTCSKAAKAGAIPTIQQNGDHKSRIRNENGTTNGSVSPKSLPSPTSTNGTNSDSSSSGTSEANSAADAKKSTEPTTPMDISTDADADQEEPISFLVKWSVDEVCDYIRSLAGYSDYAEDFANHEIDGQALVLLNENHLVKTMNIKLGPALKIMSQIEAIKKKGAPQTESTSP